MSLNPAERIAADLVWSTLASSGQWPDRHQFVLALDDEGFTLRDAQGVLRGISTSPSNDPSSKERGRLTLRGWAAIDDAQPVVGPLGQVAARLAREFVTSPIDPEKTTREAPWSAFRGLWPADAEWKQICAIIREGLEFPFDWSAQTPDESFLHVSVEILRYERVQTLRDVLNVSSGTRGRTRVGLHPAGRHREFLRRVFDHALHHQEWPSTAPFAIRERELGFVPDLQRDLSAEGFVRGEFSEYARSQIELKPHAVAAVDDSGNGRELILRVLAECRSRWRRTPGVTVTSSELADALDVKESALKPWLLFLSWSEWISGSTLSGVGTWSLRPNELILKYRDIDSWDTYLAVRPGELSSGAWFDGLGLTGANQRPSPPDLSIAVGRLRRILLKDQLATIIEVRLDEFARVFAVEAWQAAMILLGSAMEGVLLDVLGRNAGKAGSCLPTRKRTLTEAGLGDLLCAAEGTALINAQVRSLATGLKEFRDLIHPNRAAASNWRPTPEGTRACAVAFENLVADLDQAIDDGRMAEFER